MIWPSYHAADIHFTAADGGIALTPHDRDRDDEQPMANRAI